MLRPKILQDNIDTIKMSSSGGTFSSPNMLKSQQFVDKNKKKPQKV